MNAGQAAGDMDLDRDARRGDAGERAAMQYGDRHRGSAEEAAAESDSNDQARISASKAVPRSALRAPATRASRRSSFRAS